MLTVVYPYNGRSVLQFEFHLSPLNLLLTGLIGYLVAAALAAPAGLLLGARYPTAVTIPATCVLLLGVVVVVFANGSGLLTVGRVLSGLGTGAAAGATVALILKLPKGRGAVAGVTAALAVLALLLAPVIGQMISVALSFRLNHLLAIPFLLVALVVSGVTGLVRLTAAKRAVPPAMPYPPAGPWPPANGWPGPGQP